jgi:hypothetical protein
MQWINGTERTITFTAYVTKDIASNPTVTQERAATEWALVIQPELDQQRQSAAAFNTSAPLLQGLTGANIQARPVGAFREEETETYWSRSIQPQLDFYRSLVLPRDNNGKRFVKTPPLVKLEMGTLLGKAEVVATQKYLLMNYSITITEMSPQLEPTKATVSFTFVEYIDANRTSKEQIPESTAPKINAPRIDNATTIASGISGTEA